MQNRLRDSESYFALKYVIFAEIKLTYLWGRGRLHWWTFYTVYTVFCTFKSSDTHVFKLT